LVQPKSRLIYPFEVLTILSFACAVITLRIAGVEITWWTFRFVVENVYVQLAWSFIAGVLFQIFFRWLQRKSIKQYLRTIREPAWIFLWLRIWVTSFFVTYSYIWIKLSVPLINWTIWDAQLWNLDILIHGTISPTAFLTELFKNKFALSFIDRWYVSFLLINLHAVGFFAASADNRLRSKFVFSNISVWTLGLWLYVGVPSLGPVYVYNHEWNGIRGSMKINERLQRQLWTTYLKVVASRKTGVIKAPFRPTYGIAAMPSLHVGALWLMFLWSRILARPLRVLFGVGVVITFIGSVVTGWHYAVDGYVGAILAQISFWLSKFVDNDPDGLNGRELDRSNSAK
jgi:hypothetical protein